MKTLKQKNKQLEERIDNLNTQIIALKQENAELDQALKENNLGALHEIKALIKNLVVQKQLVEMIISNHIIKNNPDEHEEHLMALKGLRDLINQLDVINKFLPEQKQ